MTETVPVESVVFSTHDVWAAAYLAVKGFLPCKVESEIGGGRGEPWVRFDFADVEGCRIAWEEYRAGKSTVEPIQFRTSFYRVRSLMDEAKRKGVPG